MQSRDTAQRAIELCRRQGADQAEALVVNQEEKAANVFNRQVRFSGTVQMTRIIVRFFRNHQGAVVVGHGFSEQVLEELIKQARVSANVTTPDKLLGPADPKQRGVASGDLKIFDAELARLPLGRAEEVAMAAGAAAARKDGSIADLVDSTLQVQALDITLCTSQHFCESFNATNATLTLKAVIGAPADNFSGMMTTAPAPSDGKKSSGNVTTISRSLAGLDIEKAAADLIQQLAGRSGARVPPSGSFPILFAPSSASAISSMLLQFSSGPVAMYSSEFALGKIGERICSPLITLIDDPLKEAGIATTPFDHEGVKPRRKVVIENGISREHLLNSYYGRARGRDSTGNALANGTIRFGVRPSNAYIEAGDSNPESILADVRQGFYVTKFLSQAFMVTTNFSQAAVGFWIENGKIAYPVRAATISAPLADMLQNIIAVGNYPEKHGAGAAPVLLVSEMHVNPLAH